MMDPTQCDAELLAARAAADDETLIELATDLRDWLRRRGLPPQSASLADVPQVLAEVLGPGQTEDRP